MLETLFNPRTDDWQEHFRWRGPKLIGKTAIGRTTVEVLRINDPVRVAQRSALMVAKLFPPKPRK